MGVLAPGEDAEGALFGAGCAYLLFGAYVALWRGGQSGGSGGLAQELLQRMVLPLRRARGTLEPSLEDEGEKSDAQQAAREFQRRRVALTQALLPHAHLGSMVVIAAMWWGGTLPTSFAQKCSSLANAIILMVLWIFPSAYSGGSAVWIYSAQMAILSATVWPMAIPADTVLVYANGTWVVALGLSIGTLKPWLNAFWIFCINAIACLTLAVGERSCGQCANADPIRESLQLLTISIVTVLCLIAFDRLSFQLTRLELEAQSSRNELTAAQSVLRSVCDVVVVVDSSLRLREDSPELCSMLFLNRRRSLRQEDVRSFLASAEDCTKFDEWVRAATASGQPSGEPPRLSVAFHVSMKDSAGITLEVEVFVVPFLNRENQQSHLVGIREQQSAERAAEPRGSEGRVGTLCTSGLLRDEADEGCIADELVRSSSSSSAAGSSAGVLEDTKVSACVDLLSPAWKITSVTQAFQTCMRLTEEEVDFLPLVKRADQGNRLIEFVQSVALDREDKPAPATFGEPIFLRSAYMRRLNLGICASLELDWCPDPRPTPQGLRESVRLSLVEISWCSGSRHGPLARGEPRQTPRVMWPSPRPDATPSFL